MNDEQEKPEHNWKKELSPEQFRVLRQKGTERAFTGEYYNHKEPGTYLCVGCGNKLFDSATKFDSGSGWPSFWDVIDKGNVVTIIDKSSGMVRTEVQCANCGGHLGHVFTDGPQDKTGVRYCVNSASLHFIKDEVKGE